MYIASLILESDQVAVIVMTLNSDIIADFGKYVMLLSIAVTLFVTYYAFNYNSKTRRKSKLPPGPRAVPLLGNLVQMVKDPHLKFSKWANQYGKIYTIHLSNRTAIVVSDVIWMKELFGTMASTGKFKTDTIMLLSQGSNGIMNTVGTVWEEQRQFCMRKLRQLGYGQSSSMEPLIMYEANEVCDWIKETSRNDSNGIVDVHRILNQATINALWTFVAGERLSFQDSCCENLWSELMNSVQYTMKTGLGFFPWLKYIAPKLSGFVDYDKACKTAHEFIGGKFEEHKRSLVKGQRRDLIDMYIEYMNNINESAGNEESSFFGERGWKNSVSSVVELFAAGGQTTSTTLEWASVYLSHYPHVQRKLQAEIDEVVGRDRDPTFLDKARMPYTEAVILETLRVSTVAQLGVPHELLEDISFHGYKLPKGLILMANIYHVHYDPEIWGDPKQFRPERFIIDESLKDYLVPFQIGKRQCLGEKMAKDVMYLFLVKLFQQFIFQPVSSVSREEYFKPDVGILLRPKCSKFRISFRENR